MRIRLGDVQTVARNLLTTQRQVAGFVSLEVDQNADVYLVVNPIVLLAIAGLGIVLARGLLKR